MGIALGAGFALAAVLGAVISRVSWQALVETYTLTNIVIGLGFLVPGAVVLAFHPHHVVGTLILVCGLAHLASAAATMLGFVGLDEEWPSVVVRTLSTVSIRGLAGGHPPRLPARPPPLSRTGACSRGGGGPLAWLVVASGGYQLLTGVLSDGSLFTGALSDGTVLTASERTDSILSVGLTVPDAVTSAAGTVNGLTLVGVVVALVMRYRRGAERTRRQLLWLILAVVVILGVNVQRLVTGDGPILLLLSSVLLPTAIGVAIVRHELFDIRLVLSRTLLYALVLSVIVAVYAGSVAGLSLLVPEEADRGVSVTAAIVVAILFTPVRLFLQRAVDRAFYGSRSDPSPRPSASGRGCDTMTT